MISYEWFLLCLAVLILITWIIGKIEKGYFWQLTEKAESEKASLRIERYFKRRPEVWRLYEYARNRGIVFETQEAEEALDDLIRGEIHWRASYIPRKNRKKQPRLTLKSWIAVPIDVLEFTEIRNCEKIIFASEAVKELTEPLKNNADFLKQLGIYLEKLGKFFADYEKYILKLNLFSLSHEIGHLEIAEKDKDGFYFYSRCRFYPAIGSRPSCFLNELYATLRGLEILEELGLREIIDREFILTEGKENSLIQCKFCEVEIAEGRCPAVEEIKEVLKKFF